MSIIISIHTEHAEKIYRGVKKYELRKSLYPRDVSNCGVPGTHGVIYIYETRPVKKITGYMKVDNFLWNMSIGRLWNYVKDEAAVTWEEFEAYFKNTEEGDQCAWHIKEAHKYQAPIDPYMNGPWHPPQSWRHVNKTDVVA